MILLLYIMEDMDSHDARTAKLSGARGDLGAGGGPGCSHMNGGSTGGGGEGEAGGGRVGGREGGGVRGGGGSPGG